MRNVMAGLGCALAVALLLGVAPCRAGVVISNLGDPVGGTSTVAGTANAGGGQDYAQQFLTPYSFVLGGIEAPVGNALGTFTATAELVTQDMTTGGPSTTVVATFDVPTIPAGSSPFGVLTFTPTTSVTLSANTDYWFILSAGSGSGSYQWNYTNTNSPSFVTYATNNGDGTAWTLFPNNGPELIAVLSASPAVPEPTSMILIATGLPIAYQAFARRKARRVGR